MHGTRFFKDMVRYYQSIHSYSAQKYQLFPKHNPIRQISDANEGH